jgi:hypothetical protein
MRCSSSVLATSGSITRKRGDVRYPAELRERITAWVIAKRDRGESWTELSAALGMPVQTLMRWTETHGTPASAMRPVDVVDAPPSDTVTIVTSVGLRVEGVPIDTAIAILRGIA